MSMNRKEEIVLITLELAAEKGLANVSMSMIADKIGIKKPSLYKHFASKEEIVEAMYEYLRRQAKEKANIKENSRRPGRMTRRDSFIWHGSRKAGGVKLTTPIFQE